MDCLSSRVIISPVTDSLCCFPKLLLFFDSSHVGENVSSGGVLVDGFGSSQGHIEFIAPVRCRLLGLFLLEFCHFQFVLRFLKGGRSLLIEVQLIYKFLDLVLACSNSQLQLDNEGPVVNLVN